MQMQVPLIKISICNADIVLPEYKTADYKWFYDFRTSLENY